jgi:hypothetical protein
MSDPDYGSFHVEEEETLDERLAEEQPDPAQDPELFATEDEDDPLADLPEPDEAGLELDPDHEPGT